MNPVSLIMQCSHFNLTRHLMLIIFCAYLVGCRQPASEQKQSTQIPAAQLEKNKTEPTVPPEMRTKELSITFSPESSNKQLEGLELKSGGITLQPQSNQGVYTSAAQPIDLLDSAPFLAVAARWETRDFAEAKLTISVRASTTNEQWGEWQPSSLDGDPKAHAALFFFPADTKYFQYRVDLSRSESHLNPTVQALRFRFISPGQSLAKNSAAPPLVTRSEWYCPATAAKQPKRQSAPIQHLILHHTATEILTEDWPAVVRTIWDFHTFTNRWGDLGYHYLIDPNGAIYAGKAGGDQAVGTHFSCANSGTIGIALLGNFINAAPTDAALNSLQHLLAQKCQEYKLNPLGTKYHRSTGLNLPQIAGHREANQSHVASVCAGTKCPGDALYAIIPEIRRGTESLLANAAAQNHTQAAATLRMRAR